MKVLRVSAAKINSVEARLDKYIIQFQTLLVLIKTEIGHKVKMGSTTKDITTTLAYGKDNRTRPYFYAYQVGYIII